MKKKIFADTQLKSYVPQTIILPSLSITNFNVKSEMRKKKPNLKVNTENDASVNKENKEESDSERPSTATLEKPQILDIKFIRKIDMSLIKKEFLSITNLCRVPLTVIKVFEKTGTCERPLSLPSTSDKSSTDSSSKRSKTSLSTFDNDKPRPTTSETMNLKKINPPRSTSVSKGFVKKTSKDPNNNEKLAKIDKTKLVSKNQKLIKLPEPCTTCGRPEQPERFHSHPIGSIKPTKKMSEPLRVPVKSTVQKPIAMKYKSKLNDCKKENESDEIVTRMPRPASNRGPKTLMCYVCGRDFGTASLPLHEPKCLEKWHRENAILPPSQRRKIPTKPEVPMSSEQWNQHAWQSCQASLVPCDNCGRTFLPDRLTVHQRSCKNNNELNRNTLESSRLPSAIANNVPCPICSSPIKKRSLPRKDKVFSQQAIKIGSSPGVYPEFRIPDNANNNEKEVNSLDLDHTKSMSRKPKMVSCYICGRLFSLSSIYIHEPQCLKKWKIANDQLPANKKRSEPIKPDIKLTGNHIIDLEAMNDVYWNAHLSQLVPCNICRRTFNPDRIDIHERCCKG